MYCFQILTRLLLSHVALDRSFNVLPSNDCICKMVVILESRGCLGTD